jgi:hypothetical protein
VVKKKSYTITIYYVLLYITVGHIIQHSTVQYFKISFLLKRNNKKQGGLSSIQRCVKSIQTVGFLLFIADSHMIATFK